MSYLLRFNEKTKSVFGRIVLLTFYSKWAKSKKNVKLRILRIQSVESFGNPNLLIVEFRWKLIFVKLVFFRLASIKAVFFFPIGICYSCFLFSDWHLLKLFSVLRFVEQARNWPLRLRSTINHEWVFSTREFDHWRHFRTSGEIGVLRDLLIKKPMHCCRCLESQDHHQNRMFVSLLVTN